MTMAMTTPPVSAPPPPQPGTIIDALLYGHPLDASADSARVIQAIHDSPSLPQDARVIVELPAVDGMFYQPVIITKDNFRVRGRGRKLTRYQCGERGQGFIVGPFGDTTAPTSPTAADGFTFSAGGRPDLFGFADASLAPRAASAWGFATEGRTVLTISGHSLSLGSWVDGGWDYWRSRNGCTLECLVRGPFVPGTRLCGLGSYARASAHK